MNGEFDRIVGILLAARVRAASVFYIPYTDSISSYTEYMLNRASYEKCEKNQKNGNIFYVSVLKKARYCDII